MRQTPAAAVLLLAALLDRPAADARKSLRWYIDNLPRVQPFLLGDNPAGTLNTSVKVSDITSGVYECCNAPMGAIGSDGVLHFAEPTLPSPPWNVSAFASASVDTYMSLSLQGDRRPGKPQPCNISGGPAGCWTAGDSCNAALGRVDAFADEVMGLIEAYGLTPAPPEHPTPILPTLTHGHPVVT